MVASKGRITITRRSKEYLEKQRSKHVKYMFRGTVNDCGVLKYHGPGVVHEGFVKSLHCFKTLFDDDGADSFKSLSPMAEKAILNAERDPLPPITAVPMSPVICESDDDIEDVFASLVPPDFSVEDTHAVLPFGQMEDVPPAPPPTAQKPLRRGKRTRQPKLMEYFRICQPRFQKVK